jgi:hypothetical protein
MRVTGNAREAFVVILLLATLMGLAVLIRDATVLATRPLWLDEQHTWLIAGAGLPRGLQALADGADTNTPLL